MCAVYSCGTSKKTQENTQTSVEASQKVSDSSVTKVDSTKKAQETEVKGTSTTTTAQIKYTPKVNEATGKFEPFSYTVKKDGKPTTSVEVNGNGEVLITQVSKEVDSLKKQIDDFTKYEAEKHEKAEADLKYQLDKEQEITVKQSGNIFWLWLAIIILGVLLIISIYFHVVRTGVPFINK